MELGNAEAPWDVEDADMSSQAKMMIRELRYKQRVFIRGVVRDELCGTLRSRCCSLIAEAKAAVVLKWKL